jgi:hypothetical protein
MGRGCGRSDLMAFLDTDENNPLTIIHGWTMMGCYPYMEAVDMFVSEGRKITMARYNKENRAKILFQEAELRDRIRLEMIEAYGGKCLHCGEADPIVLTLDHINDDPGPEYEAAGSSARGGKFLYRLLKQQGWPKDRFQLLCFNCNMKKEHKRRRDAMVERHGPPPEPSAPLTRGEARAKSGPSINNESGFKGVIWNERRQRWQAGLRVNGEFKFFGRFKSIIDAAKAYREGAKAIWGDLYTPLSDEEIEATAVGRERSTLVSERSAEELGL